MPPIPVKSKNTPKKQVQRDVSAANVYDDYGRRLDSLLRSQNRTNREQEKQTAINRQHAAQYESDTSNNKLIYRDVFPGRKYKLTLSDTTWMGGSNVVTIGYTVGSAFTQISSTATAPGNNVFDIEIPSVSAIDTLEIRLVGSTSSVRGYIGDNTDSSSISEAVAVLTRTVEDLMGRLSGLEDRVTALEDAVSQIQNDVSDLDDRVTALEEAE